MRNHNVIILLTFVMMVVGVYALIYMWEGGSEAGGFYTLGGAYQGPETSNNYLVQAKLDGDNLLITNDSAAVHFSGDKAVVYWFKMK